MSLRHVVINGWFWGSTGTGSGQYLHQLLSALAGAAPGTRWTVLAPDDRVAQSLMPGVTVVSLEPVRLPRPLQKIWWEQATMPRMAARLKADVLWTPYWASPLFCALPTVVTIHDLIPLLLPEYSRGLRQRTYNTLVAASARRATAVVTVSRAGARDVVEHLGIDAARVQPVHHGPNFQRAPEAAEIEHVRTAYGLPSRYFLYLGGFDARKNLATLMSAYARYLACGGDPSYRLVIAGRLPETDEEFAPSPRRLAQEAGVGAQVDFVGWVDEDDKPAIYAGSTALLFPSLYEGFGMPILEAMQAGAPVVTSGQ